jgi:threonine dehydratase
VINVLQARARIKARILRTPLRRSEWLSDLAGRDVFLKLESLQPTGSFKIRGALNAAIRHVERHGGTPPPIVTASAGNHGRALAYAAESLGLRLTVYVPRDAPRAKRDAIARHGAELTLVDTYDETERSAKRHAASGDAIYISPYADADVIAGAATIALEIFEDLPEVATIVVPIGGGGLASGIATVARTLAPRACRAEAADVRREGGPLIVGVEAAASTAFSASLAAGRITEITVGPSIADGLTGNLDPDSMTFEIVRTTVDRIVTISEQDIAGAMHGLASHDHLIVEGAGSAAVAAIRSGKCSGDNGPLVAIVSGANIDLERFVRVLGSVGA